MNLKNRKIFQATIICIMQFTFFIGIGQTKKGQHIKNSKISLFEEISIKDSLLFSAYNNLEIEKYRSLISENIEFFHDENGLIDSKDKIVESLKKIAKTKKGKSYSIRRELIKNTLQIHEISGIGALETGMHQFVEKHKRGKTITQAKFIHLWKKEQGNWVIAKVFSYDHQPVKKKINPDKKIITLTQKQMDIYKGNYQFAPQFILRIIREGNKLFGLAQGDKIQILPYKTNKFLISRDNSKLEFLLNDKGVVVGIEMQTKKGIMKAKKIINK